ncbi:carboxymuconolactone decarboxylase family protein [Paenibacillus sp. NPDC058071]|uniref:carboxymuconolactone decarboxylase family protein n=1 Tax=Paenibacillus sp. NPDC058071 TaxID=3346326 RepID=UPI0036DCCE1E
MTRVESVKYENITGEGKEAYEQHEKNNSLTNMKKVLLQDYATYEAYMGWYTSWTRLGEIVGKRAATIYAHSISTTNNCMLCSLFFVRDLRTLGIDPANLVFDEKEQLLSELGQQIVKDPTNVSEQLFAKLKKHHTDNEIVAIIGFAGQMIATNNFNSILKIDIDQSLLPLQGDFKPAVWRTKTSE